MYRDREIVYRRYNSLVFVIDLYTNFLDRTLLLCFLFLHQMTPLHLAAESGRIKILGYLVDQGADINIQDDNGVIICDHTYHAMLVD